MLNRKNVIIVAVIVLCAGVLYGLAVKTERAQIGELQKLVEEKESQLRTYADHLKGRTIPDEVETAIRSCAPEARSAVDRMIGGLATLPAAELPGLDEAYTRCAYVDTDRQKMTVFLLEQTLADYETLARALADATYLTDKEHERRSLWNKLVELEARRVGLAAERAEVQQDIIRALMAGAGASDDAIEAARTRAGEIINDTSATQNEIGRVHATIGEL